MQAATLERVQSPDEGMSALYAVMNINSGVFSNIISNIGDTDVISKVNEMLGYIGPIVKDNSGQLTNVSENGIIAVFEANCENAVKCAVSICQSFAHRDDKRFGLDDLAIGINFGLVRTSTVGYGDFSMPMTISEGAGFARFMSEICGKYNSHILITESVAQRITNFNGRFNNRRLGKFHISSENKDEVVFDVFDGDTLDSKNSKRRGKLFFETGVDVFSAGNYMQARSYFIELLKADRNDTAAKQYLFLCDRCLSEQNGSDTSKYIEVW